MKAQEKKVRKLEEQKAEEESGAFYNQAFEWRFEFPEVLDGEGRFTGFDVVVGNPPYIRQEQLKELKAYFKTNYTVYQGTADLYQYFIERGMNLLGHGGLFHYIVSNKWMRANYGQPLREWMQQYQIESIIDFGDLPVFEEATTYPCLLQLRKAEHYNNFEAVEVEDLEFEDLERLITDTQFLVDQSKLLAEGWNLVNKDLQIIIEKIIEAGKPIGDKLNDRIYYGIKTGLNKAFVIDEEQKELLIKEDKNSKDLIRPFITGKDIKPYYRSGRENFIIFIPNGWTNKNTEAEEKWDWLKKEYSAIANYLEPYRDEAKSRYDQGEYWWELRPCDYYDEFEVPKIVYQVFQIKPAFFLDDEKSLCNNACYIIPGKDLFLLGFLNSQIGWLLISIFCTQIRNGYQLIYKYFSKVPIPEVSESQRQQIESLVDQILTAKRDDPEADTSELEAEIDRLVYELYGLSEEEVGIVEGSVGY